MGKIEELAKLIRYFSLVSTTAAGSGHPTSSLSATDLMSVLFFNNYFRFDIQNPDNPDNDRLIFSKGHASPLFYSLWAAAGAVTEDELLTLRKFDSPLEGHPSMKFKFTELPTGSLGQGLSAGVGMALSAKLNRRDYNTFVLLGDSEMAEGSVWEALEIGSYYKLNNLIGVLDVNRLGQRGETMLGWDVAIYQERISSFGWETIVIDGHNLSEISSAYKKALHQDYYLSYLMGAKNIKASDLEKLKVEIIQKVSEDTYKIKIPFDAVDNYLELVEQKMENGFWNEILGPEIKMIFKHKNGKIEKFVLNEKNAGEIYSMMLEFNNQPSKQVQNPYQEIIAEWASGKGADGFYADYFKPTMIIAKTIKGKGVSFIENKDGWHGKALSGDELTKALEELGSVDKKIRGELQQPERISNIQYQISNKPIEEPKYDKSKPVATRKAYGNALNRIYSSHQNMVVLDAEVSNSTFSEYFKKEHLDRFFEMFIAEQNMVSAGAGMARRGDLPFISTFAAFFTRAFDQLRMTAYSNSHIICCGSHAGVSIGEDGASQMALEDISMFRSLLGSTVLYPSDAVSTEKLVEEAAHSASSGQASFGIVYIRTTRMDTPILYDSTDEFEIGGSKTLKKSSKDLITVVAAGVTLHETLKAYEELKKENINIRVVDLYSIKPIDTETLKKCAKETKAIIVVEDHYAEGGIGEAVRSAFASQGETLQNCSVYSLAVSKMPKSG